MVESNSFLTNAEEKLIRQLVTQRAIQLTLCC